jgi:two-component sensor histidine kinase/tetratricopeptide (TPR) repeat protein
MQTRIPALILLFLAFTASVTFAQNITPELSVIKEKETSVNRVMPEIRASGADTIRVKLLIKAMRIYWHSETADRPQLDSILHLGRSAYNLSLQLKFPYGTSEAIFLMSKVKTRLNDLQGAKLLISRVWGESRVRVLLSIAEYLTFNFNSGSKEFAEGKPLINQAIYISGNIKSYRWLAECQMLLGKYRFRTGDIEGGKKAFSEVISRYEREKDYPKAARIWSTLGDNMPENDHTYPFLKKTFEKAIENYALAGDRESMAYAYRGLGMLNGNHHQLDSAEHQLLRTISILQSLKKPVKFTTYFITGDFYRFCGKYDLALYYEFEAMKTSDLDEHKKAMANMLLGNIYELLGNKKNSLEYYMKAFRYHEATGDKLRYITAYYIANLKADSGDPKGALIFLTSFLKKSPTQMPTKKQLYASSFGNIYSRLGDYGKAERYYKEMLALDSAVEEEIGKDLQNTHITLMGSGADFIIGQFYIDRGRFSEAKYHLEKSLVNPQYLDAKQSLDTYLYLFKTDSALNNYLPAIKNFQRYKAMNDSITSLARSKQISELSIKYETEQRKKDIKLLQNKQKLQEAAIDRSDTIRNVIIAGALFFLLAAILAYRSYRHKQKSNMKLIGQQEEINQKNSTLQHLLSEKDNFIKEKDWLLKEVHHRVKNNLQIIMSLLSTHSIYLENNDALKAIQESQDRVQSIALIHQKLYSGDNLASINIGDYVSDLVYHLADGFNTVAKNITFVQSIDQIHIDLSQAVPLGLILNEAITNSIKYAFGKSGGQISIHLLKLDEKRIKISIEDNGKGLPEDFSIRSSHSMGMEMMKGLSKQLRGVFAISSNVGTIVSIEFDLIPTLGEKSI